MSLKKTSFTRTTLRAFRRTSLWARGWVSGALFAVYNASGSGYDSTRLYDISSGAPVLIWSEDNNDDIQHPAMDADQCYFASIGSPDRIHARDITDGTLSWSDSGTANSFTTVNGLHVTADALYAWGVEATSGDQRVTKYNKATGVAIWNYTKTTAASNLDWCAVDAGTPNVWASWRESGNMLLIKIDDTGSGTEYDVDADLVWETAQHTSLAYADNQIFVIAKDSGGNDHYLFSYDNSGNQNFNVKIADDPSFVEPLDLQAANGKLWMLLENTPLEQRSTSDGSVVQTFGGSGDDPLTKILGRRLGINSAGLFVYTTANTPEIVKAHTVGGLFAEFDLRPGSEFPAVALTT